MALIETLNASLLAARSATFTLDKWCTDHKLADETKIRAGSFAASTNGFRPSSANAWNLMNERVKFRHVELTCGDRVLSEADNCAPTLKPYPPPPPPPPYVPREMRATN